MKRKYPNRIGTLMVSICLFSQGLFAQTAEQKLTITILYNDSLFWTTYNNCDIEKFGQFFTDDLEFYHDKGGITNGLSNMVESFKKNLCSNENFRLRREVIAGTM